jgi:hypothetical protein
MSMELDEKCINCNLFYKTYDLYCSECYYKIIEIPNLEKEKFSINKFDNCKGNYTRNKYLVMNCHEFIDLFNKETGLSCKTIHNTMLIRKMIYDICKKAISLDDLYNIFKKEQCMLYTKDHIICRLLMNDAKIPNDGINKIFGYCTLDPWNQKAEWFTDYNKKTSPQTVQELFTIWYDNKKNSLGIPSSDQADIFEINNIINCLKI